MIKLLVDTEQAILVEKLHKIVYKGPQDALVGYKNHLKFILYFNLKSNVFTLFFRRKIFLNPSQKNFSDYIFSFEVVKAGAGAYIRGTIRPKSTTLLFLALLYIVIYIIFFPLHSDDPLTVLFIFLFILSPVIHLIKQYLNFRKYILSCLIKNLYDI